MTLCYSHRKIDPFVRLDKRIVFNRNLSLKAKGLLSIVFSRPVDWKFYRSEMLQHSTDGERSFDSGIKELETQGYLYKVTDHESKTGQFKGWVWHFFEEPIDEEEFKKFHRNLQNSVNGETPYTAKRNTTKKDCYTENDSLTEKVNDTRTREPASTKEPSPRGSTPVPPPAVSDLLQKEEESMTHSKNGKKDPRDFLSDNDQLELFDKLLKFIPKFGDKLSPKEIAWWIKTYGVNRVKEAVTVYLQQSEKETVNPKPQSAGAYIRYVLNNPYVKPCDIIQKKNCELAKEKAKKFPFLEVKDRYVKIVANTFRDELMFTMPCQLFEKHLNVKIKNAECYV